MTQQAYIADNVNQFNGFTDVYDRHRPSLPMALVDILTQLARSTQPKLVVDIGSGTGLSTRTWVGRAEMVIGIEPGDDMRTQAERGSAGLTGIRYQKGFSAATGLSDSCADIVTICQALHWMEPTSTFAEVSRLLRPGGVFAAIDNDFPPIVDWEAEASEAVFMARCREVSLQHGYDHSKQTRWNKDEHMARIEASGHFRYTREFAVHSTETGNAERLVGLTLSQSSVQWLLKHGVSEELWGLPTFRAEAQRILGDSPRPFYFTYRVRMGVK